MEYYPKSIAIKAGKTEAANVLTSYKLYIHFVRFQSFLRTLSREPSFFWIIRFKRQNLCKFIFGGEIECE
jgi:hypothetical protein